jgi:hypothetical protein
MTAKSTLGPAEPKEADANKEPRDGN